VLVVFRNARRRTNIGVRRPPRINLQHRHSSVDGERMADYIARPGLHNHSTAEAISSGLPAGPMGIFFSISAYASSFPSFTGVAPVACRKIFVKWLGSRNRPPVRFE